MKVMSPSQRYHIVLITFADSVIQTKKKKKTTLKLFNNQNARRVGIKYSDRQDEFMNKYERRLMDNKRQL